ncbi:MAG: class I SAM-dependent methyltransferase [Verrucomicrobia bacterium]|nr:class I SAM-dependent methyltransferase [Verrucomicrobiota bacterium]
MPDPAELAQLYSGFHPHLSIASMDHMLRVGKCLFPRIGLQPGSKLRILDVGGGGGFHCKAFETLGYGASTYIDIDHTSCTFARQELGLRDVRQLNAEGWLAGTSETFDFIHCRHVIEHLINPVAFCDGLVKVLAPGGVLLLQFPNGDSLEYLAYWHLNIGNRLSNIRASNGFSRMRTAWCICSGKLLHGMDPPRHLWAISRRGLDAWIKAREIRCEIFTQHLGSYAFSPGFRRADKRMLRVRDFAGQHVLAPLRGGTHLIALIRHDSES